MTEFLFVAGIIIMSCVIFNKISDKLGFPMLLAFIVLGMCFGSDGFAKIEFNDYAFAEQICTVALIFIMFYGGFGTKWSQTKPIAAKAILLSSFGTILTAVITGVFCHFALKIGLGESFLLGAVISSTDAASVFSILRSKRLNLKYNTASLLELESGSNDPFAYMLTAIILSIMGNGMSGEEIVYIIFAQISYGILFGIGISMIALFIIKRYVFSNGFDMIFLVSVALIAYAMPSFFGGNGYLATYIAGIILGNNRINNKKALVNFFDGTTGLMQMILFFLLGLLSFPSQLPNIAPKAILIALFITFIARPVSVFAILMPFKSKAIQAAFVSWAGMRGAASIVFAIMAVTDPAFIANDIFHIVFFIVLFSILIQGTLLPVAAKRMNMIDDEEDVMKTFNDYTEEVPIQFIQFKISEGHPWSGKLISEILLPPDSILVLLMRNDEKIVPNGKTMICTGDILILSGKAMGKVEGINLYEREIANNDKWKDKKIIDIPSGESLIIMIRRGNKVIIPRGNTVVKGGDILVINDVVS